eukprot:CAMPEP_0195335080 /NCGR_PEP_ID=MMETSP0708-20121125/15296_1 /TAXON_ID=33640 /ORGANISM="Asterionellopsis glacialis, Strain CCMP134" /LENGTH=61 /DNA_ID=CAMNT_0040405233 /DNA_START=95 /DNA_END=280 /DNA_ORIENTATION=-
MPNKTADHIAMPTVKGPLANAPRGLNVVSIFSNVRDPILATKAVMAGPALPQTVPAHLTML